MSKKFSIFLQYIFDLFLCSDKNDCNDLFVQALPLLLADARTGARRYTCRETDIAALHADYEALMAQDGELRAFIGRHYSKLVAAFRKRDRGYFDQVVAECVQEDAEEAGHDGDAGEDEADA